VLPDEKIGCHRLDRTCRHGVTEDRCQLWINLRGRDPQTGVEFDRWGCADAFVPLLMVENSQMQRQTAAAVESFRNEVVKANEGAIEQRREVLAELFNGLPRQRVLE
jgi:hypothetical protein